MNTPFNESFVSNHQDPVDGKTVDFDWRELEKMLGELHAELQPHDYTALSEALAQILEWLVGVNLGHKSASRIIGRRALALVWTINPGLIENSPSLAQISRLLRLNRQRLSCHASQAVKRFQVSNRSQEAIWGKRRRRESLAALNK